MEILKVKPEYTVPAAPSIVPTHSNKFASDFGNAEIPGEEDIIRVMSSLPRRFVTLPTPSEGFVDAAIFGEFRGGAREALSCVSMAEVVS